MGGIGAGPLVPGAGMCAGPLQHLQMTTLGSSEQVRTSQGQLWTRSHCNTCKCPASAALAQAEAERGQVPSGRSSISSTS
eukprot:CAMPEP_0206036370 /NCGR_PEP_ID=MMETSP1466-20131121/2720_1 /ASSEMBLY_ACC=CAM_ASM_001126 /TAXON_ID=44452 /ORGANISM="Pavlova gyrans, Strain CCMP608" /LENGTH=79 /DNA_ID=CAMNT_0053410831 /DNA_START=31 /DNA_END=268 /DNA_ORIENTATION=-